MPKLVGCACGQELTVRDELVGKRVRCPRCGQTLDVPAGGSQGADEIDEIAASLRVPDTAARPPASDGGRGEPPPGYWGVPQGRAGATAPSGPARGAPVSGRSEPAMAGAGAAGDAPVPPTFTSAVLSALGLSLASLVLLAGVVSAFACRHAGWHLGR